MLSLTPKSNCDTFLTLKTSTPLLVGMEFFTKPSNNSQDEWEELQVLHRQQGWLFNLDQVVPFLSGRTKAIVITDPYQKITWVSQGFTRMTGYTFCESFHRRPTFLQGEQTREETRQQIRTNLSAQEAFRGSIVNYRKSGQLYSCNVHIMPIFNVNQELVNFIALEEESKKLAVL
jgi:PAS domain S-box-containing protein